MAISLPIQTVLDALVITFLSFLVNIVMPQKCSHLAILKEKSEQAYVCFQDSQRNQQITMLREHVRLDGLA